VPRLIVSAGGRSVHGMYHLWAFMQWNLGGFREGDGHREE
jgi:hypothetical protein